MLRAADGSGVTEETLCNTLAFEFSYCRGTIERASAADRELFARRFATVHKRLIQRGLIAVSADGLLKTTAHGHAFLTAGSTHAKLVARPDESTPADALPAAFDDEEDVDLESLMRESGLRYEQTDDYYSITFECKLRPWIMLAKISNGWLRLRTDVMELPELATLRTKLVDTALRMNDNLTMVKFCVSGRRLCLDVQYPGEHLDTMAIKNLISVLSNAGDRSYPELFRIAVGDAELASLEAAYKRSA